MTLCNKSLMRLFRIITILLSVVSIFSIDASAQFYNLDVRLPDIGVYQGTSNLEIPIYLRNYTDSVVAFELTIITDHPEMVQLDSHSFDTSGTLSSGWQYISIDTAYETGINIRALANTINPPFVNGIGYPQTGSIPLIKIFADIGDLPDSAQSITASLEFVVGLNDLGFSDELGNLIGLSYEFYYDTLWYNCTEYFPGDTLCKTWEELEGPPADTMVIDSLHPYIDTTLIGIIDGSVSINDCIATAGDVNCNGSLNLLDAVYIINYLYKNGPPPACNADCNCSCGLNLLDVSCMISYLYNVGNECSCCSCEEWEATCHQPE